MSDDADDTREKSMLEDDPDRDTEPETPEQIAERLLREIADGIENGKLAHDRYSLGLILAVLREVEAREGERCLVIIARSGERTEAADAERDEAVKSESLGVEVIRLQTRRAEKAEAEVARLRSCSTVEIMCENPSVDSHVREWEARCLKAEAEVERLRAAATEVVMEYQSHSGEGTHQECVPGCGCTMPQDIAALAAALGRVKR